MSRLPARGDGGSMNGDPNQLAASAIEADEFRRVLGCYVTGIAVVTTCQADGTPRGITVNSFTSVSLEPPLVLVCIAHNAESHSVFRDCSAFAISILSEGQQDASRLFATKSPTKFDEVSWHPGRCGAPILDAAAAWLDCVPQQRVDAGDHLILIGRVVDLGFTIHQPLGYCRGNYITFALEQQAVIHRRGQHVHVGCILDAGGRVLLLRDATREGGWTLPVGGSDAAEGADPGSLGSVIDILGIDANFGILFSVFDGPGIDDLSIFYRGELDDTDGLDTSAAKLFGCKHIPWEALPSGAYRSMLRRYVAERTDLKFGVYVGSENDGTVTALEL